jgi:YVTN family beta-propeller protein
MGMSLTAALPAISAWYAKTAWASREDAGEVTVIDTEKNVVVARLPVGYSPTFIAVPRGGRVGYVTNYGFGLFDRPRNTVTTIDLDAMRVINTVTVGDGPMCIHLGRDPKSTLAYVANFGNPFTDPGSTVSVVETQKQTVVKTVGVGRGPVGTMPTPDGKYIFVPNYGSIMEPDNTVSVIETSGDTVAATIEVGLGPSDVKFTPDGKFAWVVNYGRLNEPLQPLTLIDLSDLTVVGNPIAKPDSSPKAIAISPDGGLVYACHFGNPFGKPGQQISVFDTRKSVKEAIAAIQVGRGPAAVKFHPHKPLAYVGNFGTFADPGDTISVIDTHQGKVVDTIKGVRSPTSIAFAKGGGLAYVTNFNCCPG